MSSEFNTYFQYSQFSMAAYAQLLNTFTGPISQSQLVAAGFSSGLADQFSPRYTVLSHLENGPSGFSATLFEKIEANADGSHDKILAIRGTDGPVDLLVDLVNVALAGSTTLNPQYIALRNYIGVLSADSNLLGTGNFTVTGHSLGGFLAQGLMADSEFKDRIDKVYTYNAPGFGGAAGSILEALGVPNPLIDPASAAKVTNLVASNGLSPIAGLGAHIGQVLPIFIEAGSPRNNHQIMTLTDALAVYDLFGKIDTQVQVQPVTDILNALSNEPATSLELAVVALQKLFDPTQSLTLQTGNRDTLYNAIQTLATNSNADGAKVVVSLVGESASDLQTMAQFTSTLALATRYALRELNPFVIAGSAALYSPHNQGGALELFNASTGTGELTTEYVTDRAAFLAKKMEINRTDGGLLTSLTGVFNDVHFKDYQSGYEISAGLFAQIVTTPQEYLFGSANSETLTGNSADDQLYGGNGHDVLLGQGGTDYLEGNGGNDTLTGGTGNDELRGGAGFDTYIYNAGDGTDQIEDADATGRIIFDQKLLQAGIRRTGDAVETYTSLDGSQTYVLSGGHLLVNGVLTVNANFESGQFGIQLRDLSDMADSTVPTQGSVQRVANNQIIFFVNQGGTDNWQVTGTSLGDSFSPALGDDRLYGLDGPDFMIGSGGRDALYGGNQNDFLIGDASGQRGALAPPGQDFLDGGDGDDTLLGYGNDDVLLGGEGADQLLGDDYPEESVRWIGHDYLDGGAGNDLLFGGLGEDVLLGGDGNDELRGDNVNGGGWNDISVDQNSQQISIFNPTGRPTRATANGGADYLDGGTGNDTLIGDGGNDILSGGADDDQLYGDDFADDQAFYFSQPGDDVLDGGAGDDLLAAGDGADSLSGGAGIDTLFGDKGDDVLDGGAEADTLLGGDGGDQLFGGGGNDLLFGDGLNNQFVAGTIGGADFLDGGDGHDELQGGVGADMLSGGAGNDRLFGQGNDDTLFGDEGDDAIAGNDGNDFLDGGVGNDILEGGIGDDTLFGGAGADVLAGSAGADIYVFNLGDGIDTIQDTAGEGNRLVFGAGISADDIGVGIGSLVVRVGLTGDAVHIQGFDPGQPTVPVGIATFEFADGTTLTQADLVARGFDLVGTAGDDVLNGGELYRGIYGLDGHDVLTGGAIDNVLDGGGGNDVIVGNGGVDQLSGGTGDDVMRGGTGEDVLLGGIGEDHLFGEDGDDQLDGGAGTDVLNGGTGQDTYVFGRGSGHDMLRDSPVEQSGPNTIQLTSNISPNEVRLQARRSEDGVNVVLEIDGTQDELTLLGAADPSLLPISQILFADGTSWDLAEILSRIVGLHVTASPAGSSLEGTGFRDVLIGAQGNDELDGRGEADRMVGGAGDDRYRVDHPGDTVVELVGEGTDTVLSQIDYVLPDHVENLLLRTTDQPTTDPVRGEGNASDNLLIGNFVNNVLIGGAGHDTFWGGFSLGSDYGPGNDDLYGGTGDDTYVVEGTFNGFDTIHDVALLGEGNRLQFGTSVRPEDVLFVQEGASLRITNAGGTDGAILADFDPSGITGSLVTEIVAFSSGIEDVTGGYETRLLALMNPTLGSDNAETMAGTVNAEVMKARGGDDVIAGGAGNDVLLGGTGHDIYLFNEGDGFDLIDDQSGAGETNLVQFGAGITQEMLRVSYNGTSGIGGLSVRIGASGDGLHFLGVSADDPTASHAIDTFHFADGSQLTFAQLFEREVLVQGTGRSDGEMFGTVANDRMMGLGGSESLSSGAGDDQLEGGAGNDVLQGGEGEDTYIFQLGAGFDRIEDDAELIDDGQGGHLANNRILFGPGITLADLSFVEVDLTIREILVGSNGDRIELPNLVDYAPGLRTISFSDGLTLDIYDLRDGGLVTDDQTIQGGPGGGVLIGGAGNDFLQSGGGSTALLGGGGSDTLVGGSGHNWISGGPGNDFLLGGSGGNTFLLSPGSGRDSIQIPNYQLLLDVSTARFSGGYGSYHPSLTLGSLVIRYGDLGDELHLLDFDPTDVFASPAIQRFEFSDRILTYEELIALGFDIEGTGGDDVLTGTNTTDRFSGFSGNDHLSGGAGADSFMGGHGNDTVHGGSGHDTYIFNLGDGIDTIEDVVAVGEGNRIQFGVGIVQADLTFTRDEVARTLTIQVGSSGTDQLLLTNFDPTGANGSLVVETLAFADGSQANLAALLGGQVNHAPTVATPLADQTVPEDAPFSRTVPANTFADQDAGDALTYSASLANGSALPAWLTFDAVTRTFNGAPDDAQVGSLDLRVTATDTGNLSASNVFTLTVTNVNEAPIVAVPLANQTAVEDSTFTFTVSGATFADVDQVHGDTLIYSASLADGAALPTWLSFDANTQMLSGIPLNSDVGTFALRVTATDTGNLTVSDTFSLTVTNVNDAPTVAAPHRRSNGGGGLSLYLCGPQHDLRRRGHDSWGCTHRQRDARQWQSVANMAEFQSDHEDIERNPGRRRCRHPADCRACHRQWESQHERSIRARDLRPLAHNPCRHGWQRHPHGWPRRRYGHGAGRQRYADCWTRP